MSIPTKRANSTSARRQLIVETAVTCFVEKGFHQTSMRDIATRAGISLGNLYNHFESKAALIEEIASLDAREMELLEQEVARVGDPEKAFMRFVDLYLSYCCQDENATLSAEIIAECLRNPEIGTEFIKSRSKLNAAVAELIQRIVETMKTKPSIDASDSAEFVLYLIEGMAMQCAFERRTPAIREVRALRVATRQLIHA